MNFKRVPTNECVVKITPRNAGNFGYLKISGRHRSPEEEYRLCEYIKSDVERHVDDVEHVDINQKYVYKTEDGEKFDTLFDVLEYLYAEDDVLPNYIFEFRRPSDNSKRTIGRRDNFKSLIEEAWKNPWGFNVKGTPLSDNQTKFLKRVIEESLKNKDS